ncbi:MAG: hypothetical protein H6555_00055 [Lewinellaceae bacterium]|nr:hypothetical protein [Lewinellaceae bacterium]
MSKKKGIGQYLALGFLTSDLILGNLFFVLFLGFLAITYIATAHYAERTVRNIQILQHDIKELRWQYMTLEAENMYNSRRTEVAERLDEAGLRPFNKSPKRIVVDADKQY